MPLVGSTEILACRQKWQSTRKKMYTRSFLNISILTVMADISDKQKHTHKKKFISAFLHLNALHYKK